MRDIKFRGKKINYGEWIYGVPVFDGDKAWIVKRIGDNFSADEVHPETVGEYTGLKDGSTDEEWYEGDIFAPDFSLRQVEVKIICYDTYQGRYKAVPLSMYLENAGNGGWTGFDIKYWNQRLGNIHDNPELLQPQGGGKGE
ncbi:YopX family protein [Paenibacillus sp. CMAA1739]|uniref:YopX family protein n=1 Tax=Paenibacillus ottowii TaxID=2315729 RepID=UPI002DB6A78C|nr:YopX family protein [Paenibacillus sp. CMAA1739]MEC4569326.1 YopX family protein [Paenibacillus sp. CMAA1739]